MQCDENKIEYIQGKTQVSPQTKPWGWQTPSSHHKAAKWEASSGLLKMLANCLSVSIFHHYVSHLNTVSQEVVSYFYVFHSIVENWVLGKAYGTGVITHEGHTLVGHSIISHSMHYLKNMGATASCSYILWLCGWLCDRRLFVSWPTNKRRSKKMTSTISAFSINLTTCKISIGIANKIKRRGSWIPNPKLECVFEIPEDSLNSCSVWRAWGIPNACTHSHSELNVWSCHRKVQECHTPFWDSGNEASIRVPRMFHSHV
jgi:hypothetical protein